MRAVLVGPPGAGKGTQAQILASELSIPKVSTGDIFRANVSNGTELGKQAQAYMDRGDLVPDEITNAMVKDRLSQEDTREGFLLDGFPRNLAQAETLDGMLAELGVKLDVVLELVVDEEEVVRRLAERARIDNRSDDNEETIRHRLVVYREQTAPLVTFYEQRGLLAKVDAVGPIEEVTKRAMAALKSRA
ncbi:adenylate kinase [Thermobifida cellulosilytica]|uniref:Adenylate kinase n=1 Tax=Thermobifida cellulosilytica TB100 TaxID=665004 RepID=A0A147KEJ5_THECS|nr:adenylate kinase [Thermobifida cellulosilytica]KUP95659.1 adenylate kinase [Thermobifida cellulosilytica TB100]